MNMKNKSYKKGDAGQKTVDFKVKSFSIDEEKNEFVFEGYASTFGNEDFSGDIVQPGAFKDTIKELGGKVKALWQHDRSMPIGMFVSLKEDDTGLAVEGRLPLDDDFVKGRVVPQLKIGSVNAMSIGYTIERFEWIEAEGNWLLHELKLREISLVTFPANDHALITNLKCAGFDHNWDKNSPKNKTSDPELMVAGNVIAEKVDDEILVIPKAVISARVAMAKSQDITQEQKDRLDALYVSMNMDAPYADNAKIGLKELQNLSKSDRAWAIKNISLSTNVSNHLAELVKHPTSGAKENSESKEKNTDLDKKVFAGIKELNSLLKSD